MWVALVIILIILGAAAAVRLNVVGVVIISLVGFASASVLGWFLSYPFLTSLSVAFGCSAAIQVGFFAGLLAQVWIGVRSPEMDKHDLPTGKADVAAQQR
jgi:hypothetical protein